MYIDLMCLALKDYTDQHLPNYGNAAFEETDYQDRTALHLAFIHEMPVEFIHALVESMTESQLNQRDYRGRRPLDYMVSESNDVSSILIL